MTRSKTQPNESSELDVAQNTSAMIEHLFKMVMILPTSKRTDGYGQSAVEVPLPEVTITSEMVLNLLKSKVITKHQAFDIIFLNKRPESYHSYRNET